jgi:iron complex transport system substrate-binding protein
MTHAIERVASRREVVGIVGGLAAGLAFGRTRLAQTVNATTVASSGAGEWTYTDVLGKTVTLPARPVRIAANLVTAAALWDLGIRPVAVFELDRVSASGRRPHRLGKCRRQSGRQCR